MPQKKDKFRSPRPKRPGNVPGNKSPRPHDKMTDKKTDKKVQASRKKTPNKFGSSSFTKERSQENRKRQKESLTHKGPSGKPSGNNSGRRFEYENDSIFWCRECNLPLIGEECGICGTKGFPITLSQPADVRFCSPYEREVLTEQLLAVFGCDPLGDRILLLNKIPGEDKTDEIIVDGLHFGVLRFELSKMDYVFEPSVEGAKLLLQHGAGQKVELKKTKNKHLNGKNVDAGLVESFSGDMKAGDFVLVTAGNLSGYGISYINGSEFDSKKDSGEKVLRVRKIDSSEAFLHKKIPSMTSCIEANKKYLQALGKNAINAIRGIANRNEYRKLPVYVSFSGGKDSLVVLDLTRAALKKREFKAFFVNTGIEFPETVEFAREYCREQGVPYEEMNSGNAFWENVGRFGPPAKDFRWCCKVCKLASAGDIEAGKNVRGKETEGALSGDGPEASRSGAGIEASARKAGPGADSVAYLTVDGKRKHESFSRAKIAASETNPFVPNQLNIFPVRDWRALEVWLYIHWRGLAYNPLYDQGFERVGCWLCPSALAAEYERVKELHPEMHERWNTFLLDRAKSLGLSEKFVEHGFWRWKELPPKMLKLAEELGISVLPEENAEAFEIEVVSGISPCKAGGFSVEAGVKGVRLKEAAEFLNVLGPVVRAEELGMLLVRTGTGTVKFFSNGNLLVSSDTKARAVHLFKETAKQFARLSRCTGCGICEKACPVGAVAVNGNEVRVSDACIRCGKCTEACVVTRYFDRLFPDFDEKLKI